MPKPVIHQQKNLILNYMTLRERIQRDADKLGCALEICLGNSYHIDRLKDYAKELGLTPDEVRQHGNLSKKLTWFTAIDKFENDGTTALYAGYADNPDYEDNSDQTETENVLDNKDTVQSDIKEITTYFNDLLDTVDDGTSDCLTDDYLADDDIYIVIDNEKVLASEVIPVSELLKLSQSDDRFKCWQNWMLPGSKFATGHQAYEILYFDRYGNCHAKGFDNRWHSFRIETIINCRVYYWCDAMNNNLVTPSLSMLYRPTVIQRNTRLKSEGSTGKFRLMNIEYDRSFIVWRLSTLLSEFGKDDKRLLKGLFDDVLEQILINEHNNSLAQNYGIKSSNDDE